MSDKRRRYEQKEVKKTIAKILSEKPLQADGLRKALEKQSIKPGRNTLNLILNTMINSGDIERFIERDNPYPLYRVTSTSKIIIELQAFKFVHSFIEKMMANKNTAIQEFNFDKDPIGALMSTYGFYVLTCMLVSTRFKTDEQRETWIKAVLDLSRQKHFYNMFKGYAEQNPKNIIKMVKWVDKKYKMGGAIAAEAITDMDESEKEINTMYKHERLNILNMWKNNWSSN